MGALGRTVGACARHRGRLARRDRHRALAARRARTPRGSGVSGDRPGRRRPPPDHISFLQPHDDRARRRIGVWSVLSIFPQTEEIAHALLASSAVLALFAGLALSTPLGNLGAGVLVAFTQPVRIGDRVTIGEQTGFVEQIN